MLIKNEANLFFTPKTNAEPAFKHAEPAVTFISIQASMKFFIFLNHFYQSVYLCPALTQLVIIAFSAAVKSGCGFFGIFTQPLP